LGYRCYVDLRYGYRKLTGFEIGPHLHNSPSLWSSYVYGTGYGTSAFKERGYNRGIALAHQPWSAPFIDRYPCQFFRKVSYPDVSVKGTGVAQWCCDAPHMQDRGATAPNKDAIFSACPEDKSLVSIA
jgi:hypothetical protein